MSGLFDAIFGGGDSGALSRDDYNAINRDSMQSLIDYVPALVDLDKKTNPQMTANELSKQQGLLEGVGDQEGLLDINERATKRINAQNAEANALQRETDLADVDKNKGRVRGMVEGENEMLFRLINNQLPQEAGHELLYKMAGDELKLNGQLSEQDQRNVQQFSRQADNDRGMLRSGVSVGNEILNTDDMIRQRQDRARAFAGEMSNREFSRGQQKINNQLSTFIDPAQLILGRQSVNQSTTGGMFGQSNFNNQNSTRPNFMNDFNGMSSSMATNQLNANLNQNNNNAGIVGGLLGGAGTAIAGIFG